MPEEQEERMLRITGTMVEEFGKWADDNGPMPEWVWYLYGNEFGKLELAPKHTDEEYEKLDKWFIEEIERCDKLESRIKELEEFAPKHTEESLRITIGLIGNKLEFAGKVRDRGRIEGVLQGLLYVVGDLVEWELPGFPWLTEDDKPEG